MYADHGDDLRPTEGAGERSPRLLSTRLKFETALHAAAEVIAGHQTNLCAVLETDHASLGLFRRKHSDVLRYFIKGVLRSDGASEAVLDNSFVGSRAHWLLRWGRAGHLVALFTGKTLALADITDCSREERDGG